jgi:hypothetical protein
VPRRSVFKTAAGTTSCCTFRAFIQSAHEDPPCTGCHADFAVKTPHENVKSGGDDWKKVANTSCQTCKDHLEQHDEYTSGAHTPVLKPGTTAKETAAQREAAAKPTRVMRLVSFMIRPRKCGGTVRTRR